MKTIKRAGIAAAIIAGVGVLAGIWVLTKDVVIPRSEKGKLDFSKIEARDKDTDQLFTFLGRDIQQIDVTVREVDYSYLTDAEKQAEESAAETGPVATPKDGKAADEEEATEDEGEAAAAAAKQQDVVERKLGLARVDAKWTLTAPVHAQADQNAVDGLANSIAELRLKGRDETVNVLDPKYGLDNPSLIAKLVLRGGRTAELRIGRDTVVGSDVYVMIEGDNTLYWASSAVKSSLTKQPREFRDKKVAHFESEDVKALVLDASGSRVVCEQTGKKKEREWWLTKPVEARAADASVTAVLDAVKTLEAKDFVDDVKSLSNYGLDKPTIVARLDFGKDTDDIVVKLGKRTEKSTVASTGQADSLPQKLVYCMTEGRDEVFLVEDSVIEKLDKKPFDLRDTSIVDFDVTKVNKIVIDLKTGKDIELTKTDGKWSLQKPEFANADFSKVDNFLYNLKDLKAAEFLDDKDVSPSVSGLDSPEITVQLTLEDKEGLTEIKFGYPVTGGMRYYCQTSLMDAPVLVSDMDKAKVPTSVDAFKEEKAEAAPAIGTSPTPAPPPLGKGKE